MARKTKLSRLSQASVLRFGLGGGETHCSGNVVGPYRRWADKIRVESVNIGRDRGESVSHKE